MNKTKVCRDINQLTPDAQEACKIFLEACKKARIHIFVTETYRSQDRQEWLYAQGRMRSGPIVTWTKNSNHTSGMAWDIAASPPNELYDYHILCEAGRIAQRLGIEWGGMWKPPDRPHFQINSKWVNLKKEHKVEKIEIMLNGVMKKVDTIYKDGHNFIKLRDLVDPKIRINYDKDTKTPKIEVV